MQRSDQQTSVEESEPAEPESNSSNERSYAQLWDVAIEIILAALLLFMPMALGTSSAKSELVVFIGVAAMCACLVGKLIFQPGAKFLWSAAYVPMVLFIAVAAAQMLPLSPRVIHAISRHTLELKQQLLSDAPGADEALKHVTLSFYPPGTRHDLHIVLTAAAIMVVVANTFRTPRQIRRLLMEVCAVGAVIGIIALVQDYFRTDLVYGAFKVPAGSLATGGPFIDRSHFAQFMNLSIGFAIGLLMVRLQEIFPRGDISPGRLAKPWLDPEVWAVWLAILVIMIGATSVAFCMSRAGLVTMLVSGVAVGVAIGFSGKSRGRGSILTLVALIVFACVLYLGFDSITARFATAKDLATAGGRLQAVKDLYRDVWPKFPILGTGLGTHRTFFPMFDTSTSQTQPYFVEVEFAQLMEEMGLVGVGLVLIFILIIAANFLRGLRRKHPVHGAALGLAFGLGAVFLHSFTDFGQHFLPAASLSAVSCGLVLALSRSMRPMPSTSPEADAPAPSPSAWSRLFPRLVGIAASIVLVATMGAILPNAIIVQRAETHANLAEAEATWMATRSWSGDDDVFLYLLREGQAASDLCPDDVFYRYQLNRYRWLSICRTPKGEHTDIPERTEDWKARADMVDHELQGCRVLCPTYGDPLSLDGLIEYFYTDAPEVGLEHIRLGAKLSPHDSMACFIAAELEADKGNTALAIERFNHAIDVDATFGPAMVQYCLDHLHETGPDLAYQVAQGRPALLILTADALDEHKMVPDLSQKCREQAFTILKESTLQPTASATDLSLLAGLYFAHHDYPAAAELYRRALAMEYAQGAWHLRYAECLAETGHPAEAYHEATVAMNSGADKDEAQKLLDRTQQYVDSQPGALPVPSTLPTTKPATQPATRAAVTRPATAPATNRAR